MVKFIADFGTIFPLGTLPPTIYDSCMSYNIQPSFSKQKSDHDVSNPQAPMVSEMLPRFSTTCGLKSTALLPLSSAMEATSRNSSP
jgi:hypothetical protein